MKQINFLLTDKETEILDKRVSESIYRTRSEGFRSQFMKGEN